MRNARVFISCGQRTASERQIGKSIEDYFKSRGFETYFAERVHSPEALTENIFEFLRQSEYFVFVDFKRERIDKGEHRGSLFVNQELAISTFLKLPGIGFSEVGVKREGILDYQIYNAIPFTNGLEVIDALGDQTQTWDNTSVNELSIKYDSATTSRNVRLTNHRGRPLSDWYHLEVKNRNKSKHAFSCLCYLTKLRNLNNNRDYEVPSNELMWSGIADIMVNVIGDATRELDAFYIIHGEKRIRFHQRPLGTTNPRYRVPDLVEEGKYLLEYTIISANFHNVSQRYILEFTGSEHDVVFKEVD